jgi:DNA-binding transcriptional regulator YiaG
MPIIEQPELAELVCGRRVRLKLTHVEFAVKLGVFFQSINRWENARTKPLPLALKQIEQLLHQRGVHDKDLLAKYFQNEEQKP